MDNEIKSTDEQIFERARPGDSVTLVAGDRSTQITVGFRRRATTWIKEKAKAVWDRVTPENFLYFYLTRWDKDPAEAVHRSCAYYLSSFGGVPSHILSSSDCESFYGSLSTKLRAEIEAAKESANSSDPAARSQAEDTLRTIEAVKQWDADADSDTLDVDSSNGIEQSIYE